MSVGATVAAWPSVPDFVATGWRPPYWTPEMENDEGELAEDLWVSLSQKNFLRASELWETEGRESEEPYFGWLSTEIPAYSRSTLSLETSVHTQPVGLRPLVVVEPSDHPLAVEQREGISVERVQEFAELFLHDAPPD